MYSYTKIDLTNLDANLEYIKNMVGPRVKLMAVIKQNAYGHGLVQVGKRCESNGIDMLGVHAKEEALELLESHVSVPILIQSNVIEGADIPFLIKNDVRFSIRDEFLLSMLDREAAKLNTKANVHIKVDTGMNRLGINEEVAADFVINAISAYKHVEIEGLFSHFSSADSDAEYTKVQLKKFWDVIDELERRGVHIPIKHISNSAGVFAFADARLDMVRPGISIYGVSPFNDRIEALRPVLSLKTRVVHIKSIPPKSFVSYGKTYETTRQTVLAVLGIGYGDGYPWSLANKGQVIIRGKKHKVVGRVCMDQILIDVTDDPDVKIGDVVTLIGRDGESEISAEEVAALAGTIPYEILTRLQHLPKHYIS
jgi:alanine racemase